MLAMCSQEKEAATQISSDLNTEAFRNVRINALAKRDAQDLCTTRTMLDASSSPSQNTMSVG